MNLQNSNSNSFLKIGIGLCYYEDLDGIKRLYDSLYKTETKIDIIIAVDGRYKQFTSILDDSSNILSSEDIHYYLISNSRYVTIDYTNWNENPTEIEKRNKYLEYSKKDVNGIFDLDFLIVIDTDEFIEGNWSEFYQNLIRLKEKIKDFDSKTMYLHDIRMIDKGFDGYPDNYIPRPRIFYQPFNIEYVNSHYTWQNRLTKERLGFSRYVVEGIKIIHDQSHRSLEYEQNMKEYQKLHFDVEKFYV